MTRGNLSPTWSFEMQVCGLFIFHPVGFSILHAVLWAFETCMPFCGLLKYRSVAFSFLTPWPFEIRAGWWPFRFSHRWPFEIRAGRWTFQSRFVAFSFSFQIISSSVSMGGNAAGALSPTPTKAAISAVDMGAGIADSTLCDILSSFTIS